MPSPDPHSRQRLFPPIGDAGQDRLGAARVALVGCGALGAAMAEQLARAGVGHLRLVDRDVVEWSNLGRQALYDAEDAEEGRPKAVACARHLGRLAKDVALDPRVADLNASNAEELLEGVDLLLDGSDNFALRYLLNDVAVKTGRPWIYGACIAARGMTAVILPGETPCLRCLFPDPPPAGSAETCDTAGIIAPAAHLIASLQVAEALKLLVGARDAVRRSLLSVELWPYRLIELGGRDPAPRGDCPCCGTLRFEFLEAETAGRTLLYCGRDAVQVVPPGARPGRLDLERLEARFRDRFPTRHNGHVLRVEVPEGALTLFDDGRALVSGTGDAERARTLYDRYVGS